MDHQLRSENRLTPDFSFCCFAPQSGETHYQQFSDIMEQLLESLRNRKLATMRLVKLSVFVDVQDVSEYILRKKEIIDTLTGFVPNCPFSVISQSPGNSLVAVEAVIYEIKDCKIEDKSFIGIKYKIVESDIGKSLFCAGLGDILFSNDIKKASIKAFIQLEGILAQENMEFSDIVRQWNYIENITSISEDKGRQNYQVFNDMRSVYYGKSEFQHSYPAATGIGQNAGGVVLEAIAMQVHESVRIVPVNNPLQKKAYHYTKEVLKGIVVDELQQKAPPKFERGKAISDGCKTVLYISGTASIIGQNSTSFSDAEQQTKTTIDNITVLVSIDNLFQSGLCASRKTQSVLYVRVYVKHKKDIPAVKTICSNYYKNTEILYLQADICRENLLVEIEKALLIV